MLNFSIAALSKMESRLKQDSLLKKVMIICNTFMKPGYFTRGLLKHVLLDMKVTAQSVNLMQFKHLLSQDHFRLNCKAVYISQYVKLNGFLCSGQFFILC